MKKTLENRIRDIAISGKGKGMPNWFNLAQYKATRERHIEICKQLMQLSDEHSGYPITYLVYFAVGKNAHRLPTFLSGYKSINVKKANTILSWLKTFAGHENNERLFRNANVMHALVRFYEKRSSSTADFKAALDAYSSDKYTFADVCKGLHITKEETEETAATAQVCEVPAMVGV